MNSNKNYKSVQPILSICIPTYKRPTEFSKMLEKLIPQLDSTIEIIVRDDSPDDNTQKIFNKKTEIHSFKKVYCRGKKIGVDAANLFLLKKSSGLFIWFLSDDDILLDGGIIAVIKIIKTYTNINFIWANFAYGNKDLPLDLCFLIAPSVTCRSSANCIDDKSLQFLFINSCNS